MAIKARLIKAGAAGVILAAGSIAYLFEGERLTTYLDTGGIPTVCIGQTGKVAVLGRVYTEDQCAETFVTSLTIARQYVEKCTPSIPDGMKPALISFVFNVGQGNYCKSTLAEKANSGDYEGACNELSRWVYDDGVKLRGLVRRREAERAECLQGI